MMNPRLKLSPPWITYINMLEALFDGDPQIAFNVDDSANAPFVTIACNNGDKNAAFLQVLPAEKEFGNVKLKISIDGPISNRAFKTSKDLMETLFDNNPVFAYTVEPPQDIRVFGGFLYVVFKNRVVQFFNDNLDDCHGVMSTLYEDIAREVFSDSAYNLNAVNFNTDVEVGNLGKPLGEWP